MVTARCCRRRRVRVTIACLVFLNVCVFIWIQNYNVSKTSPSSRVVPSLTSSTEIRNVRNASADKRETELPATTKPAVDMENDYYPFVDFKLVFPEVMPDMKHFLNHFLVVLVNSASRGEKYRQRRAAIRRTWGNLTNCEQLKALGMPQLKNLTWQLVFVLGKPDPEEHERNVEEAKRFNDVLIGNIEETYLNNVLKFFMGQLWASTTNSTYILKADDDVFVRIPKVIEYLVDNHLPRPFYGGFTYRGIAVNRAPEGKWSVSKKYFPEHIWPPFNLGAFMLLSSDLLPMLLNYVYKRKPFHTDDAYVAIAMRDNNIKVTTISSFVIHPNMGQFVKEVNKCWTHKQVAFGHNVEPEASHFLFSMLETTCREKATVAPC